MSPREPLLTHLEHHLLIGDGAMSTWLYQNGVPIGVCCEELCLSRPQLVSEVHRQYYTAGARLIETNTFGANREALSRYGMENLTYRINWEAARLAREAVGEDAYVVGSMTSITGGRVLDTNMPAYDRLFTEQAEALLGGGVDGIILETFLDLEELLLAVRVVRSLTDRPLIAQLACIEIGHTRDGYTLDEAFAHLKQAGADVVGLNCRLGPFEILRCLEQTVIDPAIPLSVFPNAGRLALADEECTYTASPEYFAEQAINFQGQGVRIIGGCCGTTPAHIAAIAKSLAGLAPVRRVNPVPREPAAVSVRPVPPASIQGTIVEKVKQRHTVIVEFDPPRDLNIEEYLQGAANLQKAGVDALTMAENSMAQVRMSNMALGAIIKNRLGLPPLVHITCRDRNLLGQQSHLMGLYALGINQILVVTGDPPRYGDLPGASAVYDVSSFDLIRMVKQFNQGVGLAGKTLQRTGNFVVGAAFNPHVSNFQNALKRLHKKIEAGADFIMTQPVYDPETIMLIHEATRDLDIPIFLGIMPLTSSRNAEYLHNEVPGIKLSEEARARMKRYSGARARQEGLEMARELIEVAVRYFQGIYLVTPFSHHEMTAELTRYIKEITPIGDRV